MKCNNIYQITQNLKSIEYDLLRKALAKYGNDYSFDFENACCPILTANCDWVEGPVDIEVHRIYINENDEITIEGSDAQGFYEDFELNASDFEAGHLYYIVEYMPEDGEGVYLENIAERLINFIV